MLGQIETHLNSRILEENNKKFDTIMEDVDKSSEKIANFWSTLQDNQDFEYGVMEVTIIEGRI